MPDDPRPSARLTHFMDQLQGTSSAATPALVAFYERLQEEGMPEERAYQLTEKFFEILCDATKRHLTPDD